MMEKLYIACAILVLVTVAIGMIVVLKNLTRADQMLAALLLGTAGVAILLLLGAAFDRPDLIDVALVFALLAVVVTVAFVRTAWSATEEEQDDS